LDDKQKLEMKRIDNFDNVTTSTPTQFCCSTSFLPTLFSNASVFFIFPNTLFKFNFTPPHIGTFTSRKSISHSKAYKRANSPNARLVAAVNTYTNIGHSNNSLTLNFYYETK